MGGGSGSPSPRGRGAGRRARPSQDTPLGRPGLPGAGCTTPARPQPSRPPSGPGARVRACPVGPKLLCAAGQTPESSLLSSIWLGWEVRGGSGGRGRERDRTGVRGGRVPVPPAPRPGPRVPFPSPTVYLPGGEILLHAQQPLTQSLQHHRRCRRRPRPQPRVNTAPHLSRRAPHSRTGPAPGPLSPPRRGPFRVPAPRSRAPAPPPPRPGSRSRSGPRRARAAEKGRSFSPSRETERLGCFFLAQSPALSFSSLKLKWPRERML